MALSATDKAILDGYRKQFGSYPKEVLREMLIDRAVNHDNPGASKDDIREYLIDNHLWDTSLDDKQAWATLLHKLKTENGH